MRMLLMSANVNDIGALLNRESPTDKINDEGLLFLDRIHRKPSVCDHQIPDRLAVVEKKSLSLTQPRRVTECQDASSNRLQKKAVTLDTHEDSCNISKDSIPSEAGTFEPNLFVVSNVDAENLQGPSINNHKIVNIARPRKTLGVRYRNRLQGTSSVINETVKGKENNCEYNCEITHDKKRFKKDTQGCSETHVLTKTGPTLNCVRNALQSAPNLPSSQKQSCTVRSTGPNNVILSRKRQYDCISADTSFASDTGDQSKKSETMSMYDPRVQSEDRAVGNGYITRGLHNDENSSSSVLGNYYHNNSQPMIATLCNIGNTCYLNSVVYTLRFAPLFLHNLHHLVEDISHINQKIGKRIKSSSLGRNVGGLHTENVRSWSSKDLASLENSNCDVPKSNQQIATEKLHELYQNLHKNELIESTEPFHADTFLRAIQDVSTIFEGNQQQDAHEFLMCVLDSIRETCQTLIKSISECPDLITNGLPEQVDSFQPAPIKERERERESSIIKTSFFSRRSKRKEDTKQLKVLRLNSPHKENNVANSTNSDQPLDTKTNIKNSVSSISTTDDETTLTSDKERLSERIKQLGLDFFTEDFEGITVSTTKCLSCETVTEQKETMIDIAVPISGYETMDIEKSQSFIQNSCITREYFRGENKYRCEQCIGYTEAIRSISYEVLPRLLVIQLSRFSGGMEKINSYLPTPFTLQCFCAKCWELTDTKKHHVYKLYSVITHVGATMSVGHYIAYTCSLDWANDYVNCPKDRRRQAQLNSLNSLSTASSNSSSNGNNGSSNSGTTSNATNEKNMGLMKKMRFGRSKASSSSDMSKQVKNLNGIPSKSIANGVEKLNISTTCPSMNCCGLRIKNYSNISSTMYNNSSGGVNSSNLNGLYVDTTDDSSQTSSVFSSGNGYSETISNSKTKSSGNSQPTWYMCDDDKIKAMSQREFEELLSPNRKIMVTPYLLFYARKDLQ